MYERMLNKQVMPSVEEMTAYCDDFDDAFTELNVWITATFNSEQSVVFPYGNSCGWGNAHRKKKKLLCNVFPENGSFCVMARLYNTEEKEIRNRIARWEATPIGR